MKKEFYVLKSRMNGETRFVRQDVGWSSHLWNSSEIWGCLTFETEQMAEAFIDRQMVTPSYTNSDKAYLNSLAIHKVTVEVEE